MASVDTLYDRLDELLPKLEDRLLSELDRVASRGSSMYLNRRTGPFFDGRGYRSDDVAEVENLANEVIALKEKLAEPLEAGATGIILFYESLRDVPWTEHPNYEAQVELARRHADALCTEIRARDSGEPLPNKRLQSDAAARRR